ncbi:ABC transporter permease [Dehalococcoides mccartyi]|nr:ABC transporter permease [Dehalococcoides mccartyi]
MTDALTVTRGALLVQSRARGWFITASLSGFFLVAPLLLMGETIVGGNPERLQRFSELSGYDNYAGYLAVPLVFAFLTNSAYSWIGQRLRNEQQFGTLERLLISLKYPISLLLGGVWAHVSFLLFFIFIGIFSLSLVADLNLNINWPAAIISGLLHLYAVYGFAFILSSLFLWIRDAFIVQQSISYFVIPILSGAGFPISIFPGWLQIISKAIPFTWAFEVERASLLSHTPASELLFEFAVIFLMSSGMWVFGFWLFNATLRRAKRTGSLGLY